MLRWREEATNTRILNYKPPRGEINSRKQARLNLRATSPSDSTALNMVSISSWPLLSCPHRLAWPRTLPFQGSNTGSNPVGDTNTFQCTLSN